MAEFPLAQGKSGFCSIQALKGLNEVHLYYGGRDNLFFSKFTNLNGNFIQNL